MAPPRKTLTEHQAREILIRENRPVPPSIEQQQRDPAGLDDELRQLRALILKHGHTDGADLLLVNVNMATAMLHLMGLNRRISRVWVERWKVVLLDGRWERMPHQGMAFDWNGQFRDG